jgi:hypothetical protein
MQKYKNARTKNINNLNYLAALLPAANIKK